MQQPSSSSSSGFSRRPGLTLAAHWLSALAILLAFCLAWSRDLLEDEAVRAALLGFHRQLGLLILMLWAVRLIARWRLAHENAEVLPAPLRWAAAAAHSALYGVLLAMPLLGWAMTNAQGHAVKLFTVVPLPTLMATSPDMADSLQEWHQWASWGLAGLVAMHIAAALWHHLIRRDGVLASMLPVVRPRMRQASQS